VHSDFEIQNKAKVLKLGDFVDRVRDGVGDWKEWVHVKWSHGWAGLVLTLPGTEEGRGFEEGHYFCSFCVNLHAISNTPMLTGMEHGLQFAWTY